MRQLKNCFDRCPINKHVAQIIGVARGGKGAMAPQFLENIVILCFKRRFSKQNSVIRLKSSILAPAKFLDWLHHWLKCI